MSRMPIVYSSRSRIEELSRNLYRIDLPMPEAIGPTNSYLFKADGIADSGRSLIVDAGCDEPETREAFDFALRELGHFLGFCRCVYYPFPLGSLRRAFSNLEAWHDSVWGY